MENFALKQQGAGAGAREGSGSFPFTRVRGWSGTSCTRERASCWLPSCSLLPALWLAEGGFHHPPASWALQVRSPVGSVYTEHFIHRTQILLTSGVRFCQVTFGSIHQVNLCIILGQLLPHTTAVTEVFTSAKVPLKISSYIWEVCCKHLACLTRNKTT